MVIEVLKKYPNQFFTSRELAELVDKHYSDELAEKRKGFANYNSFINQFQGEVGGIQRVNEIKKRCPEIQTLDKPRRLRYSTVNIEAESKNEIEINNETDNKTEEENKKYEKDLYPILISYLNQEYGLYSLRIDEKKSKKTGSKGKNFWLHPDIVSLKAMNKNLEPAVKECLKHIPSLSFQLWSFEVKKDLNSSNIRSYFSQTISNSSWANYAYLVITNFDADIKEELQMLCTLHGIGVLLLKPESLENSEILIPAKFRELDWVSIDRIVQQNSDFQYYIEQVSVYLKTQEIIESDWGK